MSHLESDEQKTKPSAPQDQTTDTDFRENWSRSATENQAEFSEENKQTETCSKTMTQKGFELGS